MGADRYIVLDVSAGRDAIRRYPDLFIAFNADRDAYRRRNGYVISEQGKPPDFVLEVASPSAGRLDVNEKRDDYAALGVLEYWRFDETGRWHGARLAGDRLENGIYRPIPINELAADIFQGYSPTLNVYLRWERGKLVWHDPATGQPILTYDDQLARALRAKRNSTRNATPATRSGPPGWPPKPASASWKNASYSKEADPQNPPLVTVFSIYGGIRFQPPIPAHQR